MEGDRDRLSRGQKATRVSASGGLLRWTAGDEREVADDLRRIRTFLRGLVWRERALLFARVAGRTALVSAAALAWIAAAPHLGVERAAGVLVLVVGLGLGLWTAAALPLLQEWAPSGDALRQAGRVEAVRPGLRGRLVTAVDNARGPADGSHEPLLALVVSRASRGIADVRGGEVHRFTRAVPALLLGLAAGVGGLGAVGLGGPRTALGWWLGGTEVAAEVAETAPSPSGEVARVGDLVLKYTFPDYTGLDPKVVENGTGDVAAPPGTQVDVVARSGDPVEAAGLVAYEESLEAALGPDARVISGRFTVRPEPGAWRFTVYRGGRAEPSRDFAIEPVQDLPPAVTLSVDDGAERVEVAVDQPFVAEWQARDDYGVRSVFLSVDGRDVEPVLERPDRRRAELGGRKVVSPRDLGLHPGDRVRLSVAALDNDTVSGAKRGESRPVEIVVLGARGRDDQVAQRRQDLVEAMVPVLADHLVDPWPPGKLGDDVARWGEVVADRYRPLSELAEELWRGMSGESADRTAVQQVLKSGRDLVRYTQVGFEPGSALPPPAESFQMTAKLRTDAIVALEDAILMLDRMLELRALGEVARQADELVAAARRMEQALAAQDPDAQELLAQLDQLERMMQQMAKQAEKLSQSGLQEYLNARQSEIEDLVSEIREAIAEGRLDDARRMMERLAQALRDLSSGVDDQMRAAESQADDEQDQARELQEELAKLEREQRALQSQVDQLRQQDRSADAADRIWQEIARRSTEHGAAADGFSAGLQQAGRSFMEQERAAGGQDAARDLRRAVEARDVRGAREAVVSGRHAWSIEQRMIELETSRRRGALPGPGRGELHGLLQQLDAIDALLDQLEQSQSQMDPESRERASELEQQQRDLQQRTQEAVQKTKQLEQRFPVRPQGMREAMEDANERMEQASQDLKDGRPMQAGGSQEMAADRLREAQQALQQARDQAREQMQQMQQGRGGPGGQDQGGEPAGHGDRESNSFRDPDELDIPGREAFQTPEEYRRALLEGMEGEVPEEYRAMKKRYFEELVSQ